jgi:tRNA modification GTPase
VDRLRTHDTICALATPPGHGAIAVVRCSGGAARRLVENALRRRSGARVALETHRVTPALFVDPATGRAVDEVLALYMAAPRSFTREDVVEVHCHGNPVQARRILAVLTASGMRAAEPGEFTRRAFLNGRLGLAEAEAVDDLVHAGSETMADVALEQLHGGLRERIASLRALTIDVAALIEANLDFPEEDIEVLDRAGVARQIDGVMERTEELAASYERGRLIRGGVRTLIAGRPNAGKSSLLNLLLKSERAIVTDVPGTTRDTIEESLAFRGVLFSLVDSAGLREAVEPVEAIGVGRARDLLTRADLVLYVADASRPEHADEARDLASADGRRFQLVVNKCDLPRVLDPGFEHRHAALSPVRLSAVTGEGLPSLLDRMHERATGQIIPRPHGGQITSERHRDCLVRAAAALSRFQASLAGTVPLDVALVDLYEATAALGHVIGEVVTEDILDRIFERFCIGK